MSIEQPIEAPMQSEPQVSRKRAKPLSGTGRRTLSVADLMRENPPEPLLEGLVHVNDILLIHAPEESFKSIFVVQIAESISLARPLLRKWKCGKSRRVGIIETEMHPAMLGERLRKMFPEENSPENILFMSEDCFRDWRKQSLRGKFDIIADWIREWDIKVLLIDTANDFFRGSENPSDERSVGEFFDCVRSLQLEACTLVRHDRKKKDIDGESHSNELIRGSAEWKEDPEAILHLKRIDKRTNEVSLEVGKLRYGAKPEPFQAWFDAGCFRLTPLPPVMAILEFGEKTRREIINECKHRFGIEERLTDMEIKKLEKYLVEGRRGHEVAFSLNPERCLESDWATYLTCPGA
jgi:hypothetical protein